MFDSKVSLYKLFSSNLIIKSNALKNSLFGVYNQLYHQNTLEEKSISKLKANEMILGILWCLQMLSFLWTPNLSIKNWQENMMIWKSIGYFRIDNICSEFGIINECLYLSIIFTFMLGFAITFLAISIYFSLSISKLFGIFRWIFNIWLIVFYIPSMTLYSIFLKYSIWPQDYILEYQNNNHSKDLDISAPLQFVIIIAIVTNFPLIYFYTQFSSEIRHSESDKTIKAKAHSKIDGHIAIFTYFLPIFYVLFDENYMAYFQFFVMVISIIIVIECEILLPFFSLYCNLIFILKIFTIMLTSFGFGFGYLMDNSLLIIFLVIILWPISAYFVVQFTIKLQTQIKSANPAYMKEINSKYELEKTLRNWLCLNDTEHKNEIIYIFEKFFIKKFFHRDKLLIIWVTNYCLFGLKDEPLAKVKLSKTKEIRSWNLEGEFQEYLCNKSINESLSNESLNLINFYQQLNLLKKRDSKLCINLMKFWEETTSARPNLKKLTNKLFWIDKNISYLNEKYRKLAFEFLDYREFLTLYASYARDVIYDYEKSNLLEIKLRGLNDPNITNTEFKKSSFLIESNGILIISGEPDNFGQILFSNSRAAEIMKTSVECLEESKIMDFIHYYYYENLKEEMQRLIHYGSSSEIDLSKGFFLSIPRKYLIEFTGKAIITSIDNNLAFMLNFQPKEMKRQTALLAETGEILCCSEYFSDFAGKLNENLIGFNIKELFSDAEMHGSARILQLKHKETLLAISCAQVLRLKVFYAVLINNHEEVQRWKNKNSHYDIEEKKEIHNHRIDLEVYHKESYRSIQLSNEKYVSTEMKLIDTNTCEELEAFENNSLSQLSDTKSQVQNKKKIFQMLTISSRSINILHVAFIISIIAVLTTNIVVLFYAFSYIDFIKNIDFPMAIAKAESRLQIAACTAQLLWVITVINDPTGDTDLKAVRSLLPGYINNIRDIYMDIASNSTKWNYCSSKTILTDKNINVWDSGHTKKESLLDMLSQSAQQGYDLIKKYNNAEDYTNEVKFLMMNGYGDGFQYINSSLYQVMECQKSLMLDFKSVMFVLLILGIGVLGLCFCLMIPFCYSVIKIENNFWNNLRKKAFQNYSEIKQSLLERLKNVHDQPEMISTNKSPTKEIFNFKNYWKYIWRVCVYFMVVIAFSLINISYLYENCTNYLAYRPDVIRELINTKIVINTFIIAASDLQYDAASFPLNYLLNIHNYANNLEIFQKSISALKNARLVLRNPKYQPILSRDYEKKYYESDSQQPYTNYLDYGAYAAEQELINSGYIIANVDATHGSTYKDWIYNISLFRDNYDEYVGEIDSYSQSVIDDQVKIIVAAFSIFVMISVIIYFIIYFVFFKNEKKYLQKINSMMRFMPV